jgi:nicotinamide riboside kinase
MKIAFTGTSSTGKTTLADKMVQTPEFSKYLGENFVSADARFILNALKHRSLDNMSVEQLTAFQTLYFVRKLELESDLIDYLTDRSFLDIAAYSMEKNTVGLDESLRDSLHSQCRRAAARYDLHIYFPFGVVPFADDGYRSLDREHELRIDQRIRRLLDEWQLKYVTLDTADLNKRVEVVKSIAASPALIQSPSPSAGPRQSSNAPFVTSRAEMDRRYQIMKGRLESLTVDQLRRLIEYPGEIVCDTYNYDGENFCALAIAFEVPKLLEGQVLTNDVVRSKIIEIGSSQIPGFIIDPTKGVAGDFYTVDRRADLIGLAREVLNRKESTRDQLTTAM